MFTLFSLMALDVLARRHVRDISPNMTKRVMTMNSWREEGSQCETASAALAGPEAELTLPHRPDSHSQRYREHEKPDGLGG